MVMRSLIKGEMCVMQECRPAAFLDRDGTINIDKDYLYRIDDFEYLNGVEEGLRLLQYKGYRLVIITNQSGIARGFYRENDFQTLSEWMVEDLKRKGIEIAGIYYCPHHPNAQILKYQVQCECRKPKTGLFWRAQKELGIDMDRSIAIGNHVRDLCICSESNVKGYLVGDLNLLDIAKIVDSYA